MPSIVRMTNPGPRVVVRFSTDVVSARLKIGTNSALTTGVFFTPALAPSAYDICNWDMRSSTNGGPLSPGTVYYYQVEVDGVLETLTPGRFKVNPVGPSSFSFVFGSCANDPNSAVFSTMSARDDDLFIHLGDMWYADGSGTDLLNYQTEMRAALSATNTAKLLCRTTSLFTPSDHDGSMNNNNSGVEDPVALDNYRQAYKQNISQPEFPGGNPGIYYSFVWGRVRFINLDCRSFKDPDTKTDDSSKTMLGDAQKTWLKSVFATTNQSLYILTSDVPWGAGAAAGAQSWKGYSTERDEIANYITSLGKNTRTIVLGGDIHNLAANDGSTTAGNVGEFISSPFDHTSGSGTGTPYTSSVYPDPAVVPSGTTVYHQYGRVTITDTGTSISASFTGYDPNNAVVLPATTFGPVSTPAISSTRVYREDLTPAAASATDEAAVRVYRNAVSSAQAGSVNAGADIALESGEAATLSATETLPSGVFVVSRKWTQASGTPMNNQVGDSTLNFSFTAPALLTDQTFTFTYTIVDSNGFTISDTVNVSVWKSLVVLYNSDGSSTPLIFRYDDGSSNPVPVANFTASSTSGFAPLAINFTDTSTGAPTSWLWNFGDGLTSTVQNPSKTYSAAGTYTVSLVASNASGSSVQKTMVISVSAVTAPTAPTSVSVVPATTSAVVNWQPPISNGGSGISGYMISWGTDAYSDVYSDTYAATTTVNVGSTVRSYTIPSLVASTPYTVSVAAFNSIGYGPPASVSFTTTASTSTVPTVPTSVTRSATSSTATISWAAPSSDGGSTVTGYTVTGNGTSVSLGSGTLTYTFSGLSGGTAYTLTVAAVNSVGTGPVSTGSVTTTALVATVEDLFTGTTGAAPSSSLWTLYSTTGSSETIQSNQLRLLTGSVGSYNDRAQVTSTAGPFQDLRVTADISTDSVAVESYFSIDVRASGTGSAIQNGSTNSYSLRVKHDGTISLFGYTSPSTRFLIGATSVVSFAAATTIHVDFTVSGSSLAGYVWTGSTKPSTPTVSGTNTTIGAAGSVALLAIGGAAVSAPATWRVDNFDLYNLSTVVSNVPSGATMPTTQTLAAPYGGTFTLNAAEDFTTVAALGSFQTVYPQFSQYEYFRDTSKKGVYTPKAVLSAHNNINSSGANGVLDYYLSTGATKETINGVLTDITAPRVAAPIWQNYHAFKYGRFAMRFKSDNIPLYKVAWLMWPNSDVWNEGEIDWPEQTQLLFNTYARPASAIPGSYVSGQGMTFLPTTEQFAPNDSSQWHVAVTDWLPGKLIFYWDGVELARIEDTPGNIVVPSVNMRWTLQVEHAISGTTASPTTTGHFYADWAVAWHWAA